VSEPGHWFERDPNWFKTAVFYEIHMRGFFDGNDDGSGDFRGLTEKLDYLQWLGVDCIWLLPCFPSPLRDGGYDIADFFGIHPDYGTIEDFKHFVDQAHQRGPARHRRPRHEPHVERPPVVPGFAHRPRRARTPTGTSGATTTRAGARRGSSSSTPSRRTGRGTRRAGSTTGTASSRTSPT
jgi:hypothetical protein